MTNRLLGQKPVVTGILPPEKAAVSETEMWGRLAKMYRTTPDTPLYLDSEPIWVTARQLALARVRFLGLHTHEKRTYTQTCQTRPVREETGLKKAE